MPALPPRHKRRREFAVFHGELARQHDDLPDLLERCQIRGVAAHLGGQECNDVCSHGELFDRSARRDIQFGTYEIPIR
jgi:hypothetical protein